MTFLGLERPIEYGRQQIFDPTTAQMVLEAQQQYANAVYNDYQQGVQDMKEFNKEYGNFMSPITADQEWWNNNVTKPVQDLINDAYANGVDLLRSPQGRAMISRLIASRPYGDMALVRQSAENAKEFIKARRDLEKQGLYNPLFAQYDGPSLDTYATLGENGQGVWDKMSPTPFRDMATFGNPYFEGMKPNIHRESKNGIDYSVESITEEDLNNIADAHFNELVSTPQGQMMFKYYRDLAGGDNNPNANQEARKMFNAAVADGQRRRIYTDDNYDDQWNKRQQIAQGWAKINQDAQELQLKRDQFEWEKDYYDNQPGGSSSSSSSSSGGGSNTSNDLPTQGAATMLSYDQDKQYMEQKEKFENDLKAKESSTYKNLNTSGQKIWADKYKKAKATLQDSKASDKQKKEAQGVISRLKQNGTQALKEWSEAYDNATDPTAWNRYSTSIGNNTPWGQNQSAKTLMQKSHEVFNRQNIIQSAVDIGVRQDMNHALGIVEDADGNKIGTVTHGTEFAPVAEAAFTGNRSYVFNSKTNRLNRIIKGKHYSVSAENESGREYGSGTIGKTKYNLIRQRVKFTDADVVNEIDSWTDDQKKEAGITGSKDEGYEVPIITKFSRGSQTWSNVDTETDDRIGGKTEAVRHRSTRQASSVLKRIQ